jgi:hypothetical protein
MQVELLNNKSESYAIPRIATVVRWTDIAVIASEKGRIVAWPIDMLVIKPAIDKSSPEETNRLLSIIADHLEIIAEELQEISGRMG